jgi:hypothetical protein
MLAGGLPAAHATSGSGQALNAATTCKNQVVNGDSGCLIAIGAIRTGQENAAETEANNRLIEAQALANNPGSVAAPIAGHALSMFASTVALQFSLSTDYMNHGVFLTPVTLGGTPSAAIANSPSGFTYNNTAKLYYDPNGASGSNGHLDGEQTFTMFQQSKRYLSSFDFWATSNDASVTPLKGSHLTHLDAAVAPNDNLELVQSDPDSVDPYGNAGSRTIDANLGGEFDGASASVGVSQTWNYPVGYAGGGVLSNDEHYGEWDVGHSSDQYAKSVQGVETWKVPINESVVWYIGGYAHWHS